MLGEKGELVFTVLGVLLCCETVKVLLRIALDILRGRPEKRINAIYHIDNLIRALLDSLIYPFT
ncbi:hypothetical protein SE963_24080 [Escherichia coli]|nr:hypothetical protein [Escherichia coli]MDX1857216.1 hypothetical protein [Escherichia coli]